MTFPAPLIPLLAALLCGATAQTLPGLHDVSRPEFAMTLRPKAVRQLLHMNWYTLWHELVTNGNAVKIQKEKGGFPLLDLETYSKAGVKVVATTFLWNRKPRTTPPQVTPIPRKGTAEWDASLSNLGHLVRHYGKWIDYLVLDNEPQGDYSAGDWRPGDGGTPHAINFLAALTAAAQAEKAREPSAAKMRVVAPGVFNLGWFEGGRRDLKADRIAELEDRVKPMLAWAAAEARIDALDAHAHAESVDDVAKILAYLGKHWKKELIIAEWDQALCATAWLNAPLDTEYADTHRLPRSLSKRVHLEDCYKKRIPLEQWNAFMSTAPFDPNFMKESFALANRHGVKVMLYSFPQYGSPQFDTCELAASRTVPLRADGTPEWNGRFAAWYRDLIKAHEAGKFPHGR